MKVPVFMVDLGPVTCDYCGNFRHPLRGEPSRYPIGEPEIIASSSGRVHFRQNCVFAHEECKEAALIGRYNPEAALDYTRERYQALISGECWECHKKRKQGAPQCDYCFRRDMIALVGIPPAYIHVDLGGQNRAVAKEMRKAFR